MGHSEVCRWVGLWVAVLEGVISPSSLTDFGFSSTSMLSTVSAGATPDAGDLAATSDSFQNIFAQVTTPASVAQTIPISSADYSWASAGDRTTTEASSTAATVNAGENGETTGSFSSQNSERTYVRSAARVWPQRTGKQESGNHVRRTDAGPTTSGTVALASAGVPSGDDPSQAMSTSNLSSAPGNKGSSGTGLEQNGMPVAAANALGGLKNLSGAAFAMHITPAGGQSNASQAALSPTSTASSSSATADCAASSGNPLADSAQSANSLQPANGTQAQPLFETSNAAGLSAAQMAFWASSAPTSTSNKQPDSAEPAPTTTEAGEVGAEDTPGAPHTVRTVQVQLAGDGEGRVDLRLVEHADGLSVSVRASDSVLTRSLQENLPELSARLAAEKYQTHTFLPSPGETSSGGSSSSSSEQSSGQSHEQSGGRSFSQGGSASGGDGSGRQQNGQSGGRQDQTPAWWRQMTALGKLSSAVSTSVQGSLPGPDANLVSTSEAIGQ